MGARAGLLGCASRAENKKKSFKSILKIEGVLAIRLLTLLLLLHTNAQQQLVDGREMEQKTRNRIDSTLFLCLVYILYTPEYTRAHTDTSHSVCESY